LWICLDVNVDLCGPQHVYLLGRERGLLWASTCVFAWSSTWTWVGSNLWICLDVNVDLCGPQHVYLLGRQRGLVWAATCGFAWT
jgi:hypothetical protein